VLGGRPRDIYGDTSTTTSARRSASRRSSGCGACRA
jgi:hypothetical protein